MLDKEIIETGSSPAAAIIWLHGLGADGHDFVPIVPELELHPGLDVRFIFPHAPLRAVTVNNGYVMRAWYDIRTTNLLEHEDRDGIAHSANEVEALIAEQVAAGISTSRIILAGFSQGGAIALHAGLRHSPRLAGIMALSTYLPLANDLSTERTSANQDLPVFMAHGLHDPVVPLAAAQNSLRRLTNLGYHPEWHDYPMPHTLCAEEIDDISQWINRCLS